MSENTYDSSNIKVLKGLDAVRKRPGCISAIRTMDRACTTWCSRSSTTPSTSSGWLLLRYPGQDPFRRRLPSPCATTVAAFPVDIHPEEGRSSAEVIMTVLHAGGKFDDNSYKVSGGLHGVGVSVVNALSDKLLLTIRRNGQVYEQTYHLGEPQAPLKQIGDSTGTGTEVRFWPSRPSSATPCSTTDPGQASARALLPQLRRSIRLMDERDGRQAHFLATKGASRPSSST